MRKKQTKRGKDTSSIAADLMLAPWVMWMRTPLLAREMASPPTARPESMRAVSEKISAAQQGAVDAQLSYFNSMANFWPEVISGRTPSVFSGVANERAVNAALQPSSRRVKSNFKRLGKL